MLLFLLLTTAHAASTFPQVTIQFNTGKVRVTSLSETLIRFEPNGPNGFEDRTTFTVVDRTSFNGGSDLSILNQTTNEAYLTRTGWDTIYLKYQGNGSTPVSSCTPTRPNSDANNPVRSVSYPNAAKVEDSAACCALCNNDIHCNMWVSATSSSEKVQDNSTYTQQGDVSGANCWPLSTMSGTHATNNRQIGCKDSTCSANSLYNPFASIVITSITDNTIKYDMATNQDAKKPLNVLQFPAPTKARAYALVDQPRFYVPEWGPSPMPQHLVATNLYKDTNGYDYTNNVFGDTYVFLFSDLSLNSWHSSRQELLTLTGSVPLLPDYAFGTWFTYWHQYTQTEAENEVQKWNTDQLPIDIWALDMNWRNSPFGCDTCKPCSSSCSYIQNSNHYYNNPNIDLFESFTNNGTGWFDFLENHSLRTYFNDHPFPADLGKALQTSTNEINFRWDGLSHWMQKGLTFWWFDANWAFSIPPPMTPYSGSGDGASWQGMDNRVWGSHVYYETIRQYNIQNPNRKHTTAPQRPVSLTKYADANMVPGLVQHQHPAQHRYPVWWTGDGVVLQASVQSMVDSGVYDLKPYVHSDCGGDYRGKEGGDLLRWAAHCVFGTILRFHGEQHQPWSYDIETENYMRQYLNLRYKLMPSLITAGHVATETGFPIVVRCDLFYPEHPEAASNEQYLHLNETLIAPIWDSNQNVTSRSVWIPPGIWEDGWSGERVTGPQTMDVSQPYSKIPMWHKVNGMTVTTDQPGLRVDAQNWNNELILDYYVNINDVNATNEVVAVKEVFDRITGKRDQILTMTQSGSKIMLKLDRNHPTREWLIRYHLAKGQSMLMMTMSSNGREVTPERLETMQPIKLTPVERNSIDAYEYFPFGGSMSRPAEKAGDIIEIRMKQGVDQTSVVLR